MLMRMPRLVAVTALPASGKTTITRYMEQSLGFVRLSGDEEMEAKYGGQGWYGRITEEQKIAAFERLCRKRDEYLRAGRDVVIDTTGYCEGFRKENLGTQQPCKKYIIWIKLAPGAHAALIRKKGWAPGVVEKWSAERKWEDPKESREYALIVYENRSTEQIMKDLRDTFSCR